MAEVTSRGPCESECFAPEKELTKELGRSAEKEDVGVPVGLLASLT